MEVFLGMKYFGKEWTFYPKYHCKNCVMFIRVTYVDIVNVFQNKMHAILKDRDQDSLVSFFFPLNADECFE